MKLHLTLQKRWYDMIASGEKREEYRSIKPYWIARLIKKIAIEQQGISLEEWADCLIDDRITIFNVVIKNFTSVIFTNGYGKHRPSMEFEIEKITIGEGKPERGAEKGLKYFVIHLGNKIN